MKNNQSHLKEKIFNFIRENKIKSAITTCEQNSSTLSKVFKSGLLQFGNTRADIKDALATAISFEIPKLERGLAFLLTMANIAPLFGILGTVLGMTSIFQTISARTLTMAPVTITDLSTGIWQALLTTIAGLVVAFQSLAVYNYFITLKKETINVLEETAEELTHWLTRLNESQPDLTHDAL